MIRYVTVMQQAEWTIFQMSILRGLHSYILIPWYLSQMHILTFFSNPTISIESNSVPQKVNLKSNINIYLTGELRLHQDFL